MNFVLKAIGGVLLVGLCRFLAEALDSAPLQNYQEVLAFFIGFASTGLLCNAFGLKKDKDTKSKVKHPAMDWPMCGPIGRFGPNALLFTFIPSYFLSLFNPFLLLQFLSQTLGQLLTLVRHRGQKPTTTRISYRLPFEGEWLIFNGGLNKETSHSWGVLSQRYAFDFVIADKNFSRHQGNGRQLQDYFCYGQPIVAAADGEVVKVVNHINSERFAGLGIADFLCRHFAGNHVIIRHAEGEYGFYAHLIKNSIRVHPGDCVKQGETIGTCGHTGLSSEPHLHFHVQDRASINSSIGLIIKFENVVMQNENADPPELLRGQFVSHQPLKRSF